MRQAGLDQPAFPEIYYPIAQNWSQVGELGMPLVVKTSGRPLALIDPIRSVIHELNLRLAIFNVKTMDRVVADSLSEFFLYLSFMTAFACLALLLAASGAYAVISFIAASRTREFAIRVAVGATPAELTHLVLRNALRLTATGLGFGLVAALAAQPLLVNLPVGIREPDAATIVPVAGTIAAIVAFACLLPARRAVAADPVRTLSSM